MAKIFISYSRRNAKTAQKLAARLRVSGHFPWIDSDKILVGDKITETIERALQNCDYMCFLVTKHALSSQWAREEVSAALTRKLSSQSIKVLPLLADRSITASDLPSFLAGRRYADFRGSFDKGFSGLLQTLESSRRYPDSRIAVKLYLRDLMESAIGIVKDRFPDYRITAVRDRGLATREWLGCSGDPESCDVEWEFDLEKVDNRASGLRRFTIYLHPIWEILMKEFPGADDIMLWTTESVRENMRLESTATIPVENCQCSALDAEVVLFDLGRKR